MEPEERLQRLEDLLASYARSTRDSIAAHEARFEADHQEFLARMRASDARFEREVAARIEVNKRHDALLEQLAQIAVLSTERLNRHDDTLDRIEADIRMLIDLNLPKNGKQNEDPDAPKAQ